jgi:hypothetical protein
MDNSHVTVVRTLYVVMEAVVWDSRLANGFTVGEVNVNIYSGPRLGACASCA